MVVVTAAASSPHVLPGSMPPSPSRGGAFSGASLYVGDLDPAVTEAHLLDLFSRLVPVVSARVCRDRVRGLSLGYGYVNFHTREEANHALELLNFTPLNGRPMRIMFSHRDPSLRRSGTANVFIKNLDSTIDSKTLQDTFASFGTVLSCKVATDINGQSKGYGFVQFEQEESAQKAIKSLNSMLMNDKKVYVGLFKRREERQGTTGNPKFRNVYIKNLPETATKEDLIEKFGTCGEVDSAIVMQDANGNSRGFGFVGFCNPDDAAAAVEKFNGSFYNDKVLYVGRAQKKAEREAELKAKFMQKRNNRLEKFQGSNLYLKNLDDDIDDEKLRELFRPFGNLGSCKVMHDAQGQSKGFGFVAFLSPEDANRALIGMNGQLIGKKPLYVALAERKEERKAKLQAEFARSRAPGAMPAVAASMPAYPPTMPRLGQPQLYFGQGAPRVITPQPTGFGFQQQLIHGFRPGFTPNLMLPFNPQRQGQSGPRVGYRIGPMPPQQQFVHHNNQGFQYMRNTRNGFDPAIMGHAVMGPMMPLPYDVHSLHAAPMDSTKSLSSALASASPEQQRLMLGERLYPQVQAIEPANVSKVTGMLLELDQTEVLHLIESPEALKNKVDEAMEVLVAGSKAAE